MKDYSKYNWYQMADLFDELGLKIVEGQSATEMKKRLQKHLDK